MSKRSSAFPTPAVHADKPGNLGDIDAAGHSNGASAPEVGEFSQLALGQRLREARREANLTLQQLSQSSGYSVTHLSQVERGHACPTIGALRKISQAIGKDIRGFLELSPLPDTSIIRRDGRPSEDSPGGLMRHEALSLGVPGGELEATLLVLKPFGTKAAEPATGSDNGRTYYLLKGCAELHHETQVLRCETGEAVHVASGTTVKLRNPESESCEILSVALGAEDSGRQFAPAKA